MQIKLLEATSSPDAQVDAEARVIRNVKVIGRTSRNGRCYGEACLRDAIPMYEGIKVNCDHRQRSPDSQGPAPDRPVSEQFGWLERVRESPTGLMADLHFLASSPLAKQIVETAIRRPGMIGLSHDAIGEARRDGDATLVERITKVFSVDVVTDPATTQSLFESKETDMPDQNALLPPEAAPADPLVAPEVATEAPAASPVATITVSFRQAAQAVLDDASLDEATVVAAIKELMRSRDKVNELVSGTPAADAAPAETTEAEGDEEEEPKEKMTPESFRRVTAENASLKSRETCRTLLESSGRAPLAIRVAALAGLRDDKLRLQLVESFPKDGGNVERPHSTGRQFTGATPAVAPTDAKEFANAVTGG